MGCEMSTLQIEEAGVLASIPYEDYHYFYPNPGESITFSCPEGYTLTDQFDIPLASSTHTVVCPLESQDQNDYTYLDEPEIKCTLGPSTPTTTPTNSPTRAPAPAPTTEAPTQAPTEEPVDSDQSIVDRESYSYVDCPIPHMTGVVGYQASSDQHQVEVVRFPLSEVNGSYYYHLAPHDIITFVCEDSMLEMNIDGMSLEPHSVNFYTYTCLEDDNDSGEFALALTCEDSGTTTRRLRGA